MKKLFYCLLLVLGFALQAQATDRYVDPSIWPATLPNYYMTVTQALNAAQSGDRIFIAPGAYATPAITLSQNIEIYSMDTTDVVQLYTGNLSTGTPITMNGTANMQVKMSGFSCGDITINGATDMQVQIWKLNTGSISITAANNMLVRLDSVIATNNLTISANGYSNNTIKLSNSQYANLTLNAGQNMILDATKVNVTSNINVSGALGSRFTFAGCTATNLNSTSCSATASNRAKINLIDCAFSRRVNLDNNYYMVNCFNSQFEEDFIIRMGNVVNSKIETLIVNSEPNGGNVADTINKILIASDTISYIGIYHDNVKFVIANNLLGQLQISKWNYFSSNVNRIINNEFTLANPMLQIPRYNVPYYNFDISNNVFASNRGFYTGEQYCSIWGNSPSEVRGNAGCSPRPRSNELGGNTLIYNYGLSRVSFPVNPGANYYCYFYTNYWGWQNYYYSFSSQGASPNVNDCAFPNRDVPGFFKWTYNGFSIPGTGSLPGNLTFINTPGTSNTVNAGNPASEYTDIDLSRNDRGRLGGPYSILNYNPANPNNSKAFIFDLDIPTQFNPASPSVNIQAKGYHRN